MASKTPCLVQTLCAKTAKSYAFCDCTPVDALGCFFVYGTGNLFSNSAQAEFGSFGSRLLVSWGFLGAKAPLDPLCYVSLSGTGNLYPNSAQAEFVGFGSWLLVSWGILDAKAGRFDF